MNVIERRNLFAEAARNRRKHRRNLIIEHGSMVVLFIIIIWQFAEAL